MAAIRRFDRYTELGPYIAWVCHAREGEYTFSVQTGGHPPENGDAAFATEEQALAAADVLAHRLQQVPTIPPADQPPVAPAQRP